MKKDEFPYTETSYFTEQGVQITVRRPILPPEEHERRLAAIRQAMEQLYEACIREGIPWPDSDIDSSK